MQTQRKSWTRQGAVKKLAMLLPVVIALTFIGCGGGSSAASAPAVPPAGDPPPVQTGPGFNSGEPTSMQVRIGDAPSDRIAAFTLTLNSITATSKTGATVNLLASPTTIEVSHLANTDQPLAIIAIPPDDYQSMAVAVGGASVTYLDPNTNQPVQKRLNDAPTVTIQFDPVMTLVAGSMINFDVDVKDTVNLDLVQNTVSLNTPVFNVTSGTAVAADQEVPENGKVEHVVGLVTAVSSTSFTLQSGQSGNSLTFTADQGTVFTNASLATLSGLVVEVEGITAADGSLRAAQVDSMANAYGAALEGLITGYNASGHPSVVMQDGSGSGVSSSMLGANVGLNLASDTTYAISANDVDMTGLPFTFDENSIVPGQRVEVGSNNSVQSSLKSKSSSSIDAMIVELQQQTVSGTVSNYVDNGDGTATFNLVLPQDGSSYLSATNPDTTTIQVYQRSNTDMHNLTNGISEGQSVQVRGLLFYDDPSFTGFSASAPRSFRPSLGSGPGSPYFALVAARIAQ